MSESREHKPTSAELTALNRELFCVLCAAYRWHIQDITRVETDADIDLDQAVARYIAASNAAYGDTLGRIGSASSARRKPRRARKRKRATPARTR